MPRKRHEFGKAIDKRIVALMRAGGTAESISTKLASEGVDGASRATIGRRMTELRDSVKGARAKAMTKARDSSEPSLKEKTKTPLPSSPDDIPEGADLETINEWLATAKRMGKVAELEGDLAAIARAGRLVTSLIDAKRKATPPAKSDPDDNPDYRSLAEDVEARLHKLADEVLRST